jgi:acyl-CoA dehydrogenase
MRFLLWEQNRIEETILPAYPHLTRAEIDAVLYEASDFAENTLGACYQLADEEECWLDKEGGVHIPSCYSGLLQAFRSRWGKILRPHDHGGLGLPPVVQYMVLELFMGAHPAFMTYVGFNGPALQLLARSGTPEQVRQFSGALSEFLWSACLCITEVDAGSDLSRISATAYKQGDGSYLLEGEKRFISAGMHELTANIIYFVLARCVNGPKGMMGLSCFIVPRYLVDAHGQVAGDNHVRCHEVVAKMGLKGCANTHLRFGASGPCQGLLLGGRENVGLLQLLSMMNPARISTGIYALGMAGSAYLHSLHYAKHRVQGKRFDLSLSPAAVSLPIIEHPDIQRMLLHMKAVTEGCRALVARLGMAESVVATDQERALMDLFTPLVKAYCSDQAWRVAELAIQIHGGNGYLRRYPIEQYARDCKVLAIWEGTNHIQAQFLLRDRLGMGVRATKFSNAFRAVFELALVNLCENSALANEVEELKKTYGTWNSSLAYLGSLVRQGHMLVVPAGANTFLEMTAELVIGWQLLEAAACAYKVLNTRGENPAEHEFYDGKVAVARFFIGTVLPLTQAKERALRYLGSTPTHAVPLFS